MASGLRAKLNAIRSSAAPAAPPRKTGGVMVKVSRLPLDPAIDALSPVGLRRMGWTGVTFDPRRCLFMDTETTGLSGGAGTVAFLVGAGFCDGDSFVVEQYLMREYADEPELIDRLARRMDGFDAVCTFNGRNFDMPLLQSRFTMCRMRHRWRDLDDLDLLYPARRAWKLRIGSCRLSRIESEILGMPREGDLPGSEVPGRYFEFLKTGDESLLTDIIDHNRQDIATLVTLLIRLCDINAAPEKLSDQRDLFSMGRSLERQGELKPARELYHIAALPRPMGTLAALTGERVAGMANWRQYHILRRSGDVDGAIHVLEQMLQRRQLPGEACVALAKLYEHHKKDYKRALGYAEQARRHGVDPDEVERRAARLKRKMEERGHGTV
ncbi:MAG: ribonuclease H-like domain-containing protein [Clostridia bacterium]|nr:ribonuclease H-like domain-containing protein [Clostridia bacterium]